MWHESNKQVKESGEIHFALASHSGNEVAFLWILVNELCGGKSSDLVLLSRNNFPFWLLNRWCAVTQWTWHRSSSTAIPEMAGPFAVPFELTDYCRQQHVLHIKINFDLLLALQQWIISLGSLMLFLNHEDHRNEGSIPAIDLEKSFDSFQWDYFFSVAGNLKIGCFSPLGEVVGTSSFLL